METSINTNAIYKSYAWFGGIIAGFFIDYYIFKIINNVFPCKVIDYNIFTILLVFILALIASVKLIKKNFNTAEIGTIRYRLLLVLLLGQLCNCFMSAASYINALLPLSKPKDVIEVVSDKETIKNWIGEDSYYIIVSSNYSNEKSKIEVQKDVYSNASPGDKWIYFNKTGLLGMRYCAIKGELKKTYKMVDLD